MCHAHAFTMAVIFLILAHLFASTAAPRAVKGVVLGITFAPWLVRYVAARYSWVELLSWIAQGAGNAVLVAVSGWECLAPRRGAR